MNKNTKTTAKPSKPVLQPEAVITETHYFIDDDYQPFGSFKSLFELNNWFKSQAQSQLQLPTLSN